MASKRPEGKVDRLALAIAKGASLAAAARAVDVPESTARRWAAEDSFRRRVVEIRDGILSRCEGVFARGACRSVKTLIDLQGKDQEAAIRHKAAVSFLDSLLKFREFTSLAAEIRSMEAPDDVPG